MHDETKEQPGLSRRRFLVVSGGAALALLLRGGLAAASEGQAGQEFLETTCGQGPPAAPRVLIAYASRCGSTGDLAMAMAGELCGLGAAVDVRLVENIKDISPYQAVMVGSAIRRGRWLSEATAFVKTHQAALGRLPLAFFVACLTMRDDTPENRQKVLAYLEPLRKAAPGLNPLAVGLFAGALDFGKLSFMDKTVMEARGAAEGDYRDLPAVKAWAAGLAPGLLKARPGA